MRGAARRYTFMDLSRVERTYHIDGLLHSPVLAKAMLTTTSFRPPLSSPVPAAKARRLISRRASASGPPPPLPPAPQRPCHSFGIRALLAPHLRRHLNRALYLLARGDRTAVK